MGLRVIVDGRMLVGFWRFRGISRYTRALVRGDIELVYFSPKTKADSYLPKNNTFQFGFRSYFLWEQISLPIRLMFMKHDYVLFPSTTAPIFSNREKTIFVLHDLIFLQGVNTSTLRQRLTSLYRRIITGKNIKRSREIICNSNFTRRQLIEYYGVSQSQNITVIPCSVEDKWFALEKKKIKSEKYLLTVSGSLKSKNLYRVLKAFAKFNSELQGEYRLKIVGVSGKKHQAFREKMRELNLLKAVDIIENISDDELMILYDNAELSLTLSTHEGFGIPVVEAMSRKTPVLASSCSSIPEVAGPNAIYADPYCEEEIYEKLILFYNMTDEDINYMVEMNYLHSIKFSQSSILSKTKSFWSKLNRL